MIKDISELHFPPVGGTRPWLITMNGQPFASFDHEEEGKKALEMYRKNVRGVNNATYNSKQDWKLTKR